MSSESKSNIFSNNLTSPISLHTNLSTSKRTSRKLIEKIFLIGMGIVIAFIFIEIVVRQMPDQSARHVSLESSHKWYLPESTNDNRDFYYSAEKPSGTFRIIVVGDTVTFGPNLHFDDTFAKRLERMLNLNKLEGHKVEVLNWGVPSYSIPQEIALVRKAALNYSADLILLQISLNDAELRPRRVARIWQEKTTTLFFDNILLRHWKTLPFFFERLRSLILGREYISYVNSLYSKRENWSKFYDALESISTVSAKSKVPVIAVVFPLITPFYSSYPFFPIHQKINEALHRLNLTELDLLDKFEEIPIDEIVSEFDESPLPNEIAHRIAADAIYEKLEDERLVPTWAVIRKMRSKPRVLLSTSAEH